MTLCIRGTHDVVHSRNPIGWLGVRTTEVKAHGFEPMQGRCGFVEKLSTALGIVFGLDGAGGESSGILSVVLQRIVDG